MSVIIVGCGLVRLSTRLEIVGFGYIKNSRLRFGYAVMRLTAHSLVWSSEVGPLFMGSWSESKEIEEFTIFYFYNTLRGQNSSPPSENQKCLQKMNFKKKNKTSSRQFLYKFRKRWSKTIVYVQAEEYCVQVSQNVFSTDFKRIVNEKMVRIQGAENLNTWVNNLFIMFPKISWNRVNSK